MAEFSVSRTKSVPLLLAASAGSLGSLKTLIDMGANILRRDEQGNNVVHLSALRFHTNVLEFFIKWDHSDVHVWTILVGKDEFISSLKGYPPQTRHSVSDRPVKFHFSHWRGFFETSFIGT